MTLLEERPAPAAHEPPPAAAPAPSPSAAHLPGSPSRLRVVLAVWVLALVTGLALVVYGFGPSFQDRAQRSLLRTYRTTVEQAVNGAVSGATAPATGDSVGIVEIGRLRLQQVVVEGVGPDQTRRGPGHVPGTAGLGQPGNAVVVGRRAGFGGVFGDLGRLRKGDEIGVTTTQGQAVYEVASVVEASLVDPAGGSSGSASSGRQGDDGDGQREVADVFGPSDGDQLTLVTSASRRPWNQDRALIVVAELRGQPYAPTLQGARSDRDTGGHPDGSAKAAAVLAVLAYGLAMGLAVVLYQRLPTRVAYLLTVAPIVALTIITGETFSRLLPAWM